MPQTLRGVGVLAPGLTTGHAPFIEEARSSGELYIDQAYELYSEENQESWRRLYERIRPRWERYANDHFLQRDSRPCVFRRTAFRGWRRSTAILEPLDRISGEGRERLRAGVSVLRLPPPPRIPHDHHDPAGRPAGLSARARHFPRRRRPRSHAHRPGFRGYSGALRRLRPTRPRDDRGHPRSRTSRPAA